jgi:hypothetical protein
MKRSASVVTIAVLVAGGLGVARAEEPAPIPDSCPVTLPTEPRYDPDLPYRLEPNANSFWYGSDALFVPIRADGRWHTDSKNDFLLLWFRKQPDWQADFPRPLRLTAHRIDADRPPALISLVQSESPGEHAAALPTLIKLQERGCWQISANYKADNLSFVVWVD